MSGSEDQGGAGRREVAYRVFAAEFDDADFSYSESDEERAPNYVVTPTGGRVNRLFAVGVLTEVENASEDVLRARIVDPTGAFVVYAGQYQPDAQAFFERAEPPMFVAVTGKARTFQPDDSEVTYTSIRPENVNEIDAETRDRWTVGTARQTLDRVRTMARALQREERGDELRAALEAEGVDTGLAAGTPLAIDHYGTTAAYLDAVRETAVQALEVVAGERDEVDAHSASPDAPGEADLATLAALDVSANVGGETADLGGALSDESATATGSTGGETAGSTTETTDPSDTATASTTEGPATESSTADSDAADSDAAEPPTATAASSAESGASASDSGSAETSVPDASASGSTGSEPGPAETTSEPATGETGAAADPTAADADDTETGESGAGPGGDDLDDFDPGEFELDEEEREEIEEEYGTEFQSGSEVGEPGEAGIETPDPEASTADSADGTADSEPTADAETTADPEVTADEPEDKEPEATAEAEPEPAEDVDVEDAVMDAMREHDDGDGAAADAIVETVTARTGAPADEVRDAIQDALMDGRCYEPDDDVYKPI